MFIYQKVIDTTYYLTEKQWKGEKILRSGTRILRTSFTSYMYFKNSD